MLETNQMGIGTTHSSKAWPGTIPPGIFHPLPSFLLALLEGT